ncbi:hypothetical protein [Bacillus niameyensis]|uniref:hypothetical protein n=1 Tax=Bacillus niameyensis TaxID=1522308 RepID=UPI001E4C3C6F|nr:hypothetical protein [Bacillus niameyensis]
MLKELEMRFGEQGMRRISDQALEDAAKEFVKELISQFQSFKDTGGSIDEITISDIYVENGVRTIRIHWKGPKGRYRIIHLNEWGTIKNPNPAGKGKIAKAMKSSEKAYRDAVKKAIKEHIIYGRA